jgi:hypothetical protein
MAAMIMNKMAKSFRFDPKQGRRHGKANEICICAALGTILKIRPGSFAYELDLFKLDHDLPLFLWRHRFFTVVIKSVRFTNHLGMTLPLPGGGNL